MTLVANIYQMNTATAEDEKIGEVALENGVVVAKPEGDVHTDTMRRLIEVHIYVNGEEIRPKREPEAFVRGLHENYRSAYFHAGPAEERTTTTK